MSISVPPPPVGVCPADASPTPPAPAPEVEVASCSGQASGRASFFDFPALEVAEQDSCNPQGLRQKLAPYFGAAQTQQEGQEVARSSSHISPPRKIRPDQGQDQAARDQQAAITISALQIELPKPVPPLQAPPSLPKQAPVQAPPLQAPPPPPPLTQVKETPRTSTSRRSQPGC